MFGSLMAVFVALWRMFRLRRRDPTTDIIFAGGVASLVYAQTAPVIFQTYFWLPFVLAMTYSLVHRPDMPSSEAGQLAEEASPLVPAQADEVALADPVSGS